MEFSESVSEPSGMSFAVGQRAEIRRYISTNDRFSNDNYCSDSQVVNAAARVGFSSFSRLGAMPISATAEPKYRGPLLQLITKDFVCIGNVRKNEFAKRSCYSDRSSCFLILSFALVTYNVEVVKKY